MAEFFRYSQASQYSRDSQDSLRILDESLSFLEIISDSNTELVSIEDDSWFAVASR